MRMDCALDNAHAQISQILPKACDFLYVRGYENRDIMQYECNNFSNERELTIS